MFVLLSVCICKPNIDIEFKLKFHVVDIVT